MGRKAEHLTAEQVESLDLFDTLADRLDEERAELLGDVLGEGRDSKRRFTGTLRARIYSRDGGKCWYCGVELAPRWHADHVIPWARGGRTVENNGVASCPSCNLRKGAKVW